MFASFVKGGGTTCRDGGIDFPQKYGKFMEFGCVFAVGVPVRRGHEPWGVGEKGQIMEVILYGKPLINFSTKKQQH